MTLRTFEDEHTHAGSGVLIRYLVEYNFTSLGVVYKAYALINGRRIRFVLGVLTWGLWVSRPRKRIQSEVIEILDLSKIGRAHV